MDSRPININPFKYRYPPTAIASILHRISGFLLFLSIPLLLWVFDESLRSAKSFAALQACFASGWVRFFVWVVISALLYHFIAGVRHLLMDISIGESRQGGRIGAYITMFLSLVLIIFAGVWLW